MPADDAPTHGPELFFGIAGAVGTDLTMVTEELNDLLKQRKYIPKDLQLSSFLKEHLDWSAAAKQPQFDESTHDRHVWTYMDAGDDLRELTGRGDALALLSIFRIIRSRQHPERPEPRTAYIFRSLKHPAEVDVLREVYGPNFFLISAYAPVEARAAFLEERIKHDWARVAYSPDDKSAAGMARDLIQRDMREGDRTLGQRLGDAFAKGDFFVDARDRAKLRADLQRFVELLFNHPFHTPTRHENAMFHSQAAALRSSAPGRQVGCAITSPEGDVIVLGTNEVPKAGGGQYWPGDDPDRRDHEFHQPDVSGSHKRTVIEQILRRLRERGWLSDTHKRATAEEFARILEGLRVHSLIEFERAVHAEMAAIVLAARTGATTQGAYLYTTTFPCHECTRHIIASGIRRVFYIEPYPKSLASDLHPDAIVIDPNTPPEDKVSFLPFVGVAPRRYLELFTPTARSRKDPSGRVARSSARWLPKGVPSAPAAQPPQSPDESKQKGDESKQKGVDPEAPVEHRTPVPEGSDTETVGADGERHDGEDAELEAADLSEDSGAGLAAPAEAIEHTSDALYIVREANAVTELEDALRASKIELREE